MSMSMSKTEKMSRDRQLDALLWLEGPRVRLDTLAIGDHFISMSGERWTITRWFKDREGECPMVQSDDDGRESMFAGCAEGVVTHSAHKAHGTCMHCDGPIVSGTGEFRSVWMHETENVWYGGKEMRCAIAEPIAIRGRPP